MKLLKRVRALLRRKTPSPPVVDRRSAMEIFTARARSLDLSDASVTVVRIPQGVSIVTLGAGGGGGGGRYSPTYGAGGGGGSGAVYGGASGGNGRIIHTTWER